MLYDRDQVWKNKERPRNSPFIDHVGIVVEDIDKAARFYEDSMGLKRHPKVFETSDDGGAKIAFIDANGYDDEKLWLKLVQPTGPGHAQTLMDKFGKGYIFELGVQVGDIEQFASRLSAQDIAMTSFDGSQLQDGENAFVTSSSDKECYFPMDVSRGVRIKLFERGAHDASLYHMRDAR